MPSSASSNEPEPAVRRLFLAIDPPAPVRTALAALAEPATGFAWTTTERLHLTLRFLGDTPSDAIAPLRAALRRVEVGGFILPTEGVGAFPPRGQPRVLWCGVGRGHPHLHQLRQRLDDTLLALGLPVEVRSFVPHFTLARLAASVAPAHAARWLRRHGDFAAPPFRVDHFALYASELCPTGAVHTLLERFPLPGG